MKYAHRYLLVTCFVWLLPFSLYAEAPVVDDSENFALLDEQPTAQEQSAARQYHERDDMDQQPLAHDTAEVSHTDNAELLNKIQGLQQDIQELRGQLEVQAHDLKMMQQQQLDFYKDLDGRLRQPGLKTAQQTQSTPIDTPTDMTMAPAEQQTATVATGQKTLSQPPRPVKSSNPADEQLSYLSAYELIKNKHYDEAIVAMQRFVEQYPQGGYTANAQYWLGELYMVKRDYPDAMTHFEVVLRDFPLSSKSSASMLKIAYALAATGKKEEAKARLMQVIKDYPDTHTAQLAANKLKSIETI